MTDPTIWLVTTAFALMGLVWRWLAHSIERLDEKMDRRFDKMDRRLDELGAEFQGLRDEVRRWMWNGGKGDGPGSED